MRRAGALFALLALTPAVACADGAPQVVLQLGTVGLTSGHLNQVAMTMGGLYATSAPGGGWLEFGVLNRSEQFPSSAYTATPHVETEILEISTGFVVGPSGSRWFFPYVKGGIGAYRDLVPGNHVYPVYLAHQGSTPNSVITDEFDMETHWGAGGSFGLGARLGPPGTLSPTVEARLHLTRWSGDDRYQLFAVTGGVWFR